jgi:hypothetical protein
VALGTLVDSNVLLDVFTNDASGGDWSAERLANAFDTGPVVINPLIFAELPIGFDRIEDLAIPARRHRARESAMGGSVPRWAMLPSVPPRRWRATLAVT